MKKIIVFVFVTSALFVSCGKTEIPETPGPIHEGDTVELQIMFDGAQASTRSFFDDVDNFIDRENQINSVRLFLYGADGNLIQTYNVYRPITTIPYVTIEVPREICGQQCTLFAIANFSFMQTGKPTTVEMFLYDLTVYSMSTFNTTVENHLNGNFDHYFMMSGYSSFYMRPYGETTQVGIELTRLLSKLAFRYRIDENFRANHNGAMIRIDESCMTNIAVASYIFHRPGIYPQSPLVWATYHQEPFFLDGYYHHIFYFYELAATNNGTRRTSMTLYGTYDYDGDFSTEADQTPFTIEIAINPDEMGIVERNTYYKIDGVIKGVGIQNLDLTFNVGNWQEMTNIIII